MLQLSSLYPIDLSVDDVTINKSTIVIRLISTKSGCRCPSCKRMSNRVHSQYQRTLKDLPVMDKKVVIRIQTRKFFCDNPNCESEVFTERFDSLIKPYARITDRLTKYLELIGFAVNAEIGSILSKQILADVSSDNILRTVKQAELVINTDYQYIGIDDWAIKRGQKYCTLICDLVTGKPIDVLPDRSYEVISEWLREHPEIKFISMDRSITYSGAVKRELPGARIVADRFHLVYNLGQTLMKYLQREFTNGIEIHLELRKEESKITEKPLSKKEKRQLELYEKKWELIQEVQRLRRSHFSIRQIARMTKLARNTVRKYLNIKEKPIPVHTKRSSILDKYKPIILNALQRNLNGSAIFKLIQEQGYKGSVSTLREYIAKIRRYQENQSYHPKKDRITRKQLYSLLFWDPSKLSEKSKDILSKLMEEPKLRKLYTIVQEYKKAFKLKDIKMLERWVDENIKSLIKEFKNFAKQLSEDIESVRNALLYKWNNGLLEGNINRIKMIKRTMYGRAGFD